MSANEPQPDGAVPDAALLHMLTGIGLEQHCGIMMHPGQ